MTESIYGAAIRILHEQRAAEILNADPSELWSAYVSVQEVLETAEPIDVKIDRLLGS